MARDKLRQLFLEDRGRFEIVEHAGEKFEVREPTVAEKAHYVDTIGGLTSEKKPSVVAVSQELGRMVIKCVYDPDGSRVFGDDDLAMFLGGRELAQRLTDAFVRVMQTSKADSGKESEETASSAGASLSVSSSGSP